MTDQSNDNAFAELREMLENMVSTNAGWLAPDLTDAEFEQLLASTTRSFRERIEFGAEWSKQQATHGKKPTHNGQGAVQCRTVQWQ